MQVFSILFLFPLYYAQFLRECNFDVSLLFSNTELSGLFDLLLLCVNTLFCALEIRCGHILKVCSVFSDHPPFGRAQELHFLWYLSSRRTN